MKKIFVDLISNWLHVTNSNIPTSPKSDFYNLKENILKRYGVLIGYDLQHIVKTCYYCDSGCWRCNDGIYEQYWVILKRYSLGSHVFHSPHAKSCSREFIEEFRYNNVIEGYIRHNKSSFSLSREYFFYLALLFDKSLFIKYFSPSLYKPFSMFPISLLSWIIRLPLLLWRKVYNYVYTKKYHLKVIRAEKRQLRCNHPGIDVLECSHQVCPKCGKEFPDDIPF